MEEEKKGKLVPILIVILFLACCGMGTFIYLNKDKLFEKEEVKEKKEKIKEEKPIVYKNLNIEDAKVVQAMENFDLIGMDAAKKYGFQIKDITPKAVITTGINGLSQEQINYCYMQGKSFTIDDFNQAIEKIVLNQKVTIDDIKNHKNERTSFTDGEYGYSYISAYGSGIEHAFAIKDTQLMIIGPCGFEGPYGNKTIRKIEKAEEDEEGKTLHVYQKVAFGKELHPMETGLVIDYYSDNQYTNKVETIEIDKEPGDWSKYDTYKLVFEKNNEKYYFVSSEMIK